MGAPARILLKGALYIRADSDDSVQVLRLKDRVEVHVPSRFQKYIGETNLLGIEMGASDLLNRLQKLFAPGREIEPEPGDVPLLTQLVLKLQALGDNYELATIVFSDKKGWNHQGNEKYAFTQAHEAAHVKWDRILDQLDLKPNADVKRIAEQRAKGILIYMPPGKTPWSPLVRKTFQMVRQSDKKMSAWDDFTMWKLVVSRIEKEFGKSQPNLAQYPVQGKGLIEHLFRKLFGDRPVEGFVYSVGKRDTWRSTPHEMFADLAGYEHVVNKMACPKSKAIRFAYNTQAMAKMVQTKITTKKLLDLFTHPKTYADAIISTL